MTDRTGRIKRYVHINLLTLHAYYAECVSTVAHTHTHISLAVYTQQHGECTKGAIT